MYAVGRYNSCDHACQISTTFAKNHKSETLYDDDLYGYYIADICVGLSKCQAFQVGRYF